MGQVDGYLGHDQLLEGEQGLEVLYVGQLPTDKQEYLNCLGVEAHLLDVKEDVEPLSFFEENLVQSDQQRRLKLIVFELEILVGDFKNYLRQQLVDCLVGLQLVTLPIAIAQPLE